MDRVQILKTLADVDPKTLEWLTNANREQIGRAIEIGVEIFNKFHLDKMPESQNLPVVKGQIGEEHVIEILNKKFNVVNTAKLSKNGDMVINLNQHKIICEVKNYNNPIPTLQIDKFRRDLHSINACGGIFISLKTPITGITDSFSIRYEKTDTRTIPCAYIVSDEPNSILMAVDMVFQIIQTFDYINSEVQSRDKIASGIFNITENLESISRARNDLQNNISNIHKEFLKTSTNLAIAENNMRENINNMREVIFDTAVSGLDPLLQMLDANPHFLKYDPNLKDKIVQLMKLINSNTPKNGIDVAVWKLSAKKCVNVVCGISFSFNSALSINIPRSKTDLNSIVNMLCGFGKKISIDEEIHIIVDESTYSQIYQILEKQVVATKPFLC